MCYKAIKQLSLADIAEATNSDEITVNTWLNSEQAPSESETEKLDQLATIVKRLSVIIKADYLPVWLRKPNPLLGDKSPLELIAAGDYKQVARMVSGLEVGSFT